MSPGYQRKYKILNYATKRKKWGSIIGVIVFQGAYAEFEEFLTEVLEPNYNSLDINADQSEEDFLTRVRRASVVEKMCQYDYQDCLDEVRQFISSKNSHVKLHFVM